MSGAEDLLADIAADAESLEPVKVINSNGVISTVVKGKLRAALESDMRARAAVEGVIDDGLLMRGFRAGWLRDAIEDVLRRRGYDVG